MSVPIENSAEPSALTKLNARSRDIRHIVEFDISRPVSPLALVICRGCCRCRCGFGPQRDAGSRGARPRRYAPHASAGGTPTEQGLRLFVDALLEFGDLGREERTRIYSEVRRGPPPRKAGFEGALTEIDQPVVGPDSRRGVVLTKKMTRGSNMSNSCVSRPLGRCNLVSEDGTVEMLSPRLRGCRLRRWLSGQKSRESEGDLAEATAEIRARRAARYSTASPPV